MEKRRVTKAVADAIDLAKRVSLVRGVSEIDAPTLFGALVEIYRRKPELRKDADVIALDRILSKFTEDKLNDLIGKISKLRGFGIPSSTDLDNVLPGDKKLLFSKAVTAVFNEAATFAKDKNRKNAGKIVDVTKGVDIYIGVEDLFLAMFLGEDDPEMEEVSKVRRTFMVNGVTFDGLRGANTTKDFDITDILSKIEQTARKVRDGELDPDELLEVIEDEEGNEVETELERELDLALEKLEKEGSFENAGERSAINTKKVDPNTKTPALDRYAIDMTKNARNGKYDPVVGREKEIDKIIEVLCCRKKNNAVLIGDPGCGKTAIIESLAMKIASGNVPIDLREKRIFNLDLNSLVSGTQYRGQYEQRLQEVIQEVTTNKNIIIFIDELHNLIGNGSSSGSGDGANILKPYLARGEFQCIGSTTTDEYRKHIEKDGALKRRFSPILVEEPSVEETIQILHGIKKVYADYHHVNFEDGVMEACAKWSGKYINDRFFPDKAISVLDMAASLAKLEVSDGIDTNTLEALEKRLEEVTDLKSKAILDSRFDEATQLRNEGRELVKKIEEEKDKFSKQRTISTVTINHVSKVVSELSNVPIDNIKSTDIDKIRSMKSELESKVIGQEEAVKQLTLALQRNIFGLRDPNKPIASFLLVGPTGVGKSLISKMVAKEFMGSENNLITIACSEYMQDWAESKLLGSAPGYVGYSDTEPRLYVLKRKPYSVILIDEVEKSSSNLYNIWLNLLEEGEVTLSSGEKVSCRNSIIIFTGNVGTKALELKGNGLGFSKPTGQEKRKQDEDTVMKEVKKEFRPEFLNRISKVIVFNSLSDEELGKIFYLELAKLQERIKSGQGYALEVSESVKDLIVSKCEPQYGARSLQRNITEFIEDEINIAMLECGDLYGKSIIKVDKGEDDKILVEFQ